MKKIVLGIALVGLLGAGYFLVKNYQKKGNECCQESAIIGKKEGEIKAEEKKVEAKSEKNDTAKKSEKKDKSEKKEEETKAIKIPSKKVSYKKVAKKDTAK